MTHDTNGTVTTSKLDITNARQEVSPFSAGDHRASINRRARKHNKNKTEITYIIHKRSTTLERSAKYFTGGVNQIHGAPTSPSVHMWIKTQTLRQHLIIARNLEVNWNY